MRLFIAINLPDPAIEHLRRVQAHCRSFAPDANYTRDVNLHLTLRFLGETPEDKLEKLKDSLRKTCDGGPLRIAASQIVSFPPRAPARVIGAYMVDKIERATVRIWPGPTFEARRVYLMQSDPTAAGSKYRMVADFDLYGENSG